MINRFEFYKELYYKELETKEHINNSMSTPINLVTGAILIITFYVTQFEYTWIGKNDWFFLGCIAINIFTLGVSAFNLISSYTVPFKPGYKYKYLPTATDLEIYYDTIVEYWKEENSREKKIGRDYEEYLITLLLDSASNNFKYNEEKVIYLFRAKRYIVYCIVSLLITCIPLVINSSLKQKNPEIYSVKIINEMSEKPKDKRPAIQGKPKPVGPTNQIIVEGRRDSLAKKEAPPKPTGKKAPEKR